MRHTTAKIISYLLVAIIVISITPVQVSADKSNLHNYKVWDGSVAEAFSGGDGTERNPYRISTAEELARMAFCVNSGLSKYETANYCLDADIDLNNINWTPIGQGILSYELGTEKIFKGKFDGQGHKIINLNISSVKTNRIGLFGTTADAYISGVNISDSTIKLRLDYSYRYGTYCGTLIGLSSNTTVTGCNTNGIIDLNCTSSIYCGGLIGNQIKGAVSGCSAEVSVFENALDNTELYMGYGGGLIGCSSGSVSKCSAYGDVIIYTHAAKAGGLIGYASENITNCYAAGNVTCDCKYQRYGGFAEAGGLVGTIYGRNSIEYCYALGNVIANSHWNAYAGGVLGRQNEKPSIYHTILKSCFTGGDVSACGNDIIKSFSGALIGDMYEDFTVTNKLNFFTRCYYSRYSKIVNYNYGPSSNDVGYSTDPDNFISESWLTSSLQFDLENIWVINSFYPELRPEIVAINLKKKPDKLVYLCGSDLETEGMIIEGIYSDGSLSEISAGYDIEGQL